MGPACPGYQVRFRHLHSPVVLGNGRAARSQPRAGQIHLLRSPAGHSLPRRGQRAEAIGRLPLDTCAVQEPQGHDSQGGRTQSPGSFLNCVFQFRQPTKPSFKLWKQLKHKIHFNISYGLSLNQVVHGKKYVVLDGSHGTHLTVQGIHAWFRNKRTGVKKEGEMANTDDCQSPAQVSAAWSAAVDAISVRGTVSDEGGEAPRQFL